MTLNRKINRLYHLLIKEKGDFESAASRIKDNGMRWTILSLAQQSNQYATELSAYMQSARTPVTAAPANPGHFADIITDEKGLLVFCNSNEKKLATAYKKILKESLIYESLEKMLGYQLDGILSASKQLKLLASLTPIAKKQPCDTIELYA